MVRNRYAFPTDTAVRRAAGGEGRPAQEGGGPFAWLGRAVVRHPWRVIALWVVAAVAVIVTSPGLPTTSNESSFLPSSYESIRATNLQDQAFPQAGNVTGAAAIIVFSRADGGQLTAADSAKVAAIARPWTPGTSPASSASRPGRRRRTTWCGPRWSPCPIAWSTARARGGRRDQGAARRHQAAGGRDRPDRGRDRAGGAELDSQQSGNQADQIVLLATLVLILVLLLMIFRSPVIALMPLIFIAVVSQVATGLIATSTRRST